MKELVVLLLQEHGVWIAAGAGIGSGIWIFLQSKSVGKGIGVALGGFAIAFFCLYPELVLTKSLEFLKWAIEHIKFG